MRAVETEVSPRQWAEWEQEKTMFDKQAQHVQKLKGMEIELAELEAKWSSWLSLPKTIIMLPVKLVVAMVFGVAYCIAVARKYELPENFWSLFKQL